MHYSTSYEPADLPTELFAPADTHLTEHTAKKRALLEKLILENHTHIPPSTWLKGHGMANHMQGMLHMFSSQPSPTDSQHTPLTMNEINHARLRVAEDALQAMETGVRPSC